MDALAVTYTVNTKRQTHTWSYISKRKFVSQNKIHRSNLNSRVCAYTELVMCEITGMHTTSAHYTLQQFLSAQCLQFQCYIAICCADHMCAQHRKQVNRTIMVFMCAGTVGVCVRWCWKRNVCHFDDAFSGSQVHKSKQSSKLYMYVFCICISVLSSRLQKYLSFKCIWYLFC